MSYSSNYQTRDLGLAAALVTIGYEVVELQHWKDRAFTFVTNIDFNDGKKLESQYYKLKLEVPAKAYSMSVRDLRARVDEQARILGV